MAINKQHEAEKIIEYIRKKTENGSWFRVTLSNIKPVVQKSEPTIVEILKLVQKDSRVISRPAKQNTYEYQYVGDVKNDIESKNKVLKNLTNREVREAEDIMFNNKITKSATISDYLSILNTYKSTAIDHTLDIEKQIADLMVLPINIVKQNFGTLVHIGVITDYEKESSPIEPNKSNNVIVETTKIETAAVLTDKHIEDKKEEQVKESKEEINTSQVQELITSLNNFGQMQQNFFNDIQKTVASISSPEEKEKISKLTSDVDGANKMIETLLLDNSTLREDRDNKVEELRIAHKHVQACREKNDNVILNVEQNLEMLIAEISNAVSDYVKIPNWNKTPQENSKFQSTIINSITNTVNSIIDFNKTNGKTED